MAREVTHDAKGPAPVSEEDVAERGGTAFVCQCGLSDDKPYCDGSHNNVADEDDDTLYKYENDDDEQPRHVVEEIVLADEDD
ncbi:MAG: CDGSH iron-sulfur domain-containing protein [Halobaculum sp.]